METIIFCSSVHGWRSNVNGHNMKSGSYVENITVRQFIAQVWFLRTEVKISNSVAQERVGKNRPKVNAMISKGCMYIKM